MGQSSTLNGVDCGFVHLEAGVAVEQNQVVTLRTVATISRLAAGQRNMTLVHDVDETLGPATTWSLDTLLRTNGVNDGFTLREVTI
jgi:hypothetical protein